MFYVRFYIISELALILDNLKDNDVLMVPVPIYIVSSVYFYAMVLLYPHVFVPSDSIHQKTRRRRRKKKSYFTLCSILCTFNYLLQIHYKICKILCSINPFMVSFSLIYFSLDFCVLLDLRFRDLIIYLEVTNLLIMK